MNTKTVISFPRIEGRASRQAHADLPDGTYEREFGNEGFSGPATHFYHSHPPTGWSDWEGPLRPRAFDLSRFEGQVVNPWNALPVLANSHLKLRLWRTGRSMDHLVRNADGDELLFVHSGKGVLFCDFGRLTFGEGDYLLLPRSTMWRIETDEPLAVLLIEATEDAYGLPDRGIAGNHAIFDPAILAVPAIDEAFLAQQDEKPWQVSVKKLDALSVISYPYSPLDAVGWKGDLLPVRLNWRDIRPMMSHRYHLPPSVHTTFTADHFIVSTFCPRPMESDPGALKLPFYHSNNDYDEVLFYHRGRFMSRDNIHPGMMTLHPSGFPHGPHPKAYEAAAKAARKETDEVAVMIDSRYPLDVTKEAGAVEWEDYVHSWKASPENSK